MLDAPFPGRCGGGGEAEHLHQSRDPPAAVHTWQAVRVAAEEQRLAGPLQRQRRGRVLCQQLVDAPEVCRLIAYECVVQRSVGGLPQRLQHSDKATAGWKGAACVQDFDCCEEKGQEVKLPWGVLNLGPGQRVVVLSPCSADDMAAGPAGRGCRAGSACAMHE